jgi:3-oxoacyl-(acyl-carrier-protein) synthase
MSDDREVWVTGLGTMSAAGVDAAALYRTMLAERCALTRDAGAGRWLGRAPDPPRAGDLRRLDRAARLFYISASEAWGSAGLHHAPPDPNRVAVLEGSSLGPLSDVLATMRNGQPVNPSTLIRCMTGAGGVQFGQSRGITGPVLHLSSGSVSAACAIADGWARIRRGEQDVVVAGGAECPLAEEIVTAFGSAAILAPAEAAESGCRPFDAHRSGTVLGEGAGVLILEAAEHARRRGAAPRAVLEGVGGWTESGTTMVAPRADGEGIYRAVAEACGERMPALGWIKAHGTGTRLNDSAEIAGLRRALGSGIATIPLTALKPIFGHALGASSALEAVAAILALEGGFVPPTLGTREVDPALGPLAVADRRAQVATRRALLLSQSFGGRAAALLLAA